MLFKSRFYLSMFFDLLDVALVNSHTVFQKLGQTGPTFLNFKIAFANSMVGKCVNHQKAFPQSCPSKRKSLQQARPTDIRNHLPEF